MVNKLWYMSDEIFDDVFLYRLRMYISNIIDQYCSEVFDEPEDITPDTLQQFLEIILVNYKYYHLNFLDLRDIGDAFNEYFSAAYKDDFPDEGFPKYPVNDRRELALSILENCMMKDSWIILPEEVPFLLQCLNAPENEISNMKKKLEDYFEQFDLDKRLNIEIPRRWEQIVEERKDALSSHNLMPVRPMIIELSMCYKEELEQENDKNQV